MQKSIISYFIFILLIIVSSFQFSSFGILGNVYINLRIAIISIISVIFLLNFKKSFFYFKYIPALRIHFWCLLLFFIITFTLYCSGINIQFSTVRDLSLAFIVLLIGLNMHLTEKQLIQLMNIYIVLYTFAAISIVYTFSSGFIIHERYLPIPKNQVAPAFGVAFILSIYLFFMKTKKSRWLYSFFIILLLASLLVIRGRAVIISVFITSFIFIFYYIKSNTSRFLIIISILLLIPLIGQNIYEALFLNYDVSDINSVSTGRMTINSVGIDFFFSHPLAGQLGSPFKGATIHNYILINLVSFGILLSILTLSIYFKYMFIIYKAIRKNSFKYFEAGPLVMVILFLISFFEYTYPYGPGSATFFPLFLLGQYFQKQLKE